MATDNQDEDIVLRENFDLELNDGILQSSSEVNRKVVANFLKGRQVATDPFLIRGYNAHSGGGDPRLNNANEIRPHAYIEDDRKPTSTMLETFDDIQDLTDIIEKHLDCKSAVSHFSSFTPRWQTADAFAQEENGSTFLVLDTTLCPDLEIYHSNALRDVGLCSRSYPDEYLIFGPVPGSAYRTIDAEQFRDAGYRELAGKIPDGHRGMSSLEHFTRLKATDVAIAKRLARLAWPDRGTRATEMVVMLTANFVGIRLYMLRESPDPRETEFYYIMEMMITVLHPELNELVVQVADHGHTLQIVNEQSEPQEVSSGIVTMKHLLVALRNEVMQMVANKRWVDWHGQPEPGPYNAPILTRFHHSVHYSTDLETVEWLRAPPLVIDPSLDENASSSGLFEASTGDLQATNNTLGTGS